MASNESAFEIELGGWNIAETVTVEARPVERRACTSATPSRTP